jgi:polysaccharide biosynthesis/export protein
MSLVQHSAVVVLAVALLARAALGAEEKLPAGSKWGLWSDPQPAAVQSGEPAAALAASPEPSDQDYILGPGDQLDISVWKDEALTRSLAVLPDGKISFPLIGELAAAGKTVAQLKKDIEGRLSRFMPEPILSLEVKQVNSQVVYVIGRVNTPGRFVLNANVNVLQALAIAGGFNPFANKSRVKIIRYEGDSAKVIPFDYDEVVQKETAQLNFGLKRGDVVVVP